MKQALNTFQELPSESRIYLVKHLVTHLVLAGEKAKAKRVLCNIFFLEAKAEAGHVGLLLEDFTQVEECMKADELFPLNFLKEALSRHITFLNRNPSSLFQCLWNLCWWYDHPSAADHYEMIQDNTPPWASTGEKLYTLVEQWRTEKQGVHKAHTWMRSLRPPSIPLNSPLILKLNCGGDISHLAVSPEPSRIAAYSTDGYAHIWDARSGEELCIVEIDMEYEVHGLTYITPESSILLCLKDKQYYILEIDKQIWHPGVTLPDSAHCVAMSVCKESVLYATNEGWLYLWNVTKKELQGKYGPVDDEIYEVLISASGNRVFAVDKNGILWCWDATSGQPMGNAWQVCGTVAVSGEGRRAAWGAFQDVSICDLEGEQKEAISLNPGQFAGVHCAAYSFDGQFLAVGNMDNAIEIWDADARERLGALYGHQQQVECIAFFSDNRFVVSGSDDASVCVWDLSRMATQMKLKGESNFIGNCYDIASHGRNIATGDVEGNVRVWATESMAEEAHVSFPEKFHVNSVRFSQNGHLLWACSGSTIKVYDVADKRVIHDFTGEGRIISAWCVSLDDSVLAVASNDRRIRVYNGNTFDKQVTLEGHEEGIVGITFSLSNQLLASGAFAEMIRIWHIATGQEIGRISNAGGDGFPCGLMQFIDDRRLLFRWEADCLRIWDVREGKDIACMVSPNGRLVTMGLTDDKKAIIGKSESNSIVVWSSESYEMLGTYAGHIGCGADVSIYEHRDRFPFLAIPSDQDSFIVSQSTYQQLACYHSPALSAIPHHPKKWFGTSGNAVHYVALEGDVDYALQHPEKSLFLVLEDRNLDCTSEYEVSPPYYQKINENLA